MKRKLRKYTINTLKSILFWALLHILAIITDGLTDNKSMIADYAVVLGNKVEENGKPSLRLQTRLDKAKELYKTGRAKKIILSGGLGKEGFEEATIMREYLQAKGIPSEYLIEDRQGYTTYQTAQNTLNLIENQNKTIIVVSHYYHISRTKLAFYKFGMKNIYGAHASIHLEWQEPYAIFREMIGFYYYLVRDYVKNK